MKISQRIRSAYRPYWTSMFDIIRFQIASTITISVIVTILRRIADLLIRSTGRVAISTGDFDFLYKTWQGPLLLIIGVLILFVYVAVDLNTQIIYASKLLNGKPDLIQSIKEGFLSIRKFFTIDGLGIVLYISLIAPIIGFGISISQTSGLYIPNFISSVIHSNTFYMILYIIFMIGFLLLGIVNIFTIHGILLSDLRSSIADDESRALMRKNWKDFLKQNLIYLLCMIGANIFVIIAAGIIPGIAAIAITHGKPNVDIAFIFVSVLATSSIIFINSFDRSFYLIRMTQLYHRYKGEEKPFTAKTGKRTWIFAFASLIILIGLSGVAAWLFDNRLDQFVHTHRRPGIIAHRAGGIEAPENTIAGLEKAIELGAEGAEIDIQRSKDGYYIINHDGNFSRLCKTGARPSDLTLEEIRGLTITDPNFPDDPQPVATFEEMLDTAKGRILLFVELKGDTADIRMVDDAVAMIKERDMVEEAFLISLKYNLIDYCENRYPEIRCAYLTFASFGKTAELNCDYLGLEEEAASVAVIDAIHESGREVLIWTPNSESSQKDFLLSDADYIITDYVSQAQGINKELSERDKTQIIMDEIAFFFK